jgi:hypothetical protein
MKYYVEAQYLPKGAQRPLDNGIALDIGVTDQEFALVPNVGDFVQVGLGMGDTEGRIQFSGKVVSRLFRYLGDTCGINLVVAETDVDWGTLIKE